MRSVVILGMHRSGTSMVAGALANAGIELDGESLSDAASSSVTLGIAVGLVVGKIVGIAGAVLILILAFTSFYTIEPEETGLVLRFGKYVRSTDPGLHFKIPFGVERVLKVPIQHSTSLRATPNTSPIPRPVSPMVPIE